MKIQLDRKNLLAAFLLFALCISFFFPSERVTLMISLVRYFALIAGVTLLLVNSRIIEYRNNKLLFGFLPLIYYLYVYLISWNNQIGYANKNTFSALLQFFIIIGLFFHLWKRNPQLAYNILLIVFAILCIWDMIDIFYNPNGSAGIGQWLFGNKNNHSLYFCLFIYMLFLKCKQNYSLINKFFLLIFMILTTVSTVIMGSSTSISSILIVDTAVIIYLYYKSSLHISSYSVLIGALSLNVLVIIGQTDFLSNIVSLFGKDLTFSERTIAWSRALLLIQKKPIFGWGMIHGTYAKEMIGYSNAHNQLLDCIVTGGVILLIFFIIILFYLAANINRIEDNGIKIFNIIFFAALLIKMIFEQIAADYLFWILLIIMFCDMSMYHNEKEQTAVYG